MRQLWTRAAVIALTAGALSACETASAQYQTRPGQTPGAPRALGTPNFPITQAEPAVTPPEPSVPAKAPASVEQDAAPPITQPSLGGQVSSQPLAPLPPPPEPARVEREVYQAPPPPAPKPAPPRAVVVTQVGGPVVDVTGAPKIHVVESGDAIDAIARGLGTTRAELAKDNDLEPPYRIKPGQKLKGPTTRAKAYVVQGGDTMFAIAKRFSVTAAALAAENDLSTGAAIKKGQKLRLPAGYKDKGPTKTTVLQAAPQDTSQAASAPPPAVSRPSSRPAPSQAAPEREPAAPSPSVAERPTTTTTLSITGPVVEVAGPRRTHTVKAGDALDAIARGLDTTRADLAKDNDLEPPYRLKPGQKLKGPATTAKAYVANAPDKLVDIAKRFSVTPKALAEENDIKVGSSIKKGQKLRLPSGFKDKGPLKITVTTPAPSRPAPTPPVAAPPEPKPTVITPSTPQPYRPSSPPAQTYPRPSAPVAAQPINPPTASRPIIESSAPPTEAEIISAGRGRFVWPLRGEVLSDFGPKGTGQRNDGLNIRAATGSPVRAAAAGEVVYAGNQVPGFGNLVLVKHTDGWVTAYAHLSTTDVKMRQQVMQGQQLGAVGATGGVTEPQLHFEVRYAPTPKDKARPVDPGLVLPR